MSDYRLICADVLDGLRQLPDESVQCVVTSPPYWGLRDYGVEGQFGLEPTPGKHTARMVEVFRAVRRVLRSDGTLWLNYGDCYCSGNRGAWDGNRIKNAASLQNSHRASDLIPRAPNRLNPPGLKNKDLVGMPWRVAFALQADGWWLRSDIIWSKPNPMPESVTDRPTKAHEYLFLLTKNAQYFYDADAIKQPTTGSNRRDVWHIATQPCPETHFAAFPEKLVELCVLAGTSAKGVCPVCGAPWERIVNILGESTGGHSIRQRKTLGWQSTCKHDTEPVPATVLDPFSGSGTTGVAALKANRHYIGIDLNPDYIEMSRKRIQDAVGSMYCREVTTDA